MIRDVKLLQETADALSQLDVVAHVGRINCDLPQMAWLVLVLRHLPDSEATFPHGKWATIQSIEAQLDDAARVEGIRILGTHSVTGGLR
jgi:hypothetical protein